MTKNEASKIIKELIRKIDIWNYEYYALDNSSVSDATFDLTMNELIKLENEFPELKTNNSPTMRVGGFVSEKFNKITHRLQMLSLGNIFDKEGLERFINNINKNISEDNSYVIEPKIDGLSISLTYRNSRLFSAVTRGDGIVGEDVYNNILTIKEIPLYINDKYKNLIIEVRGEVYISNDDFKIINENQPDDKKFANPRNAAAGSLRNLDTSIASSRNLKIFLYYIPEMSILNLETQYDAIQWLNDNKFPTSKEIRLIKDSTKIWDEIENFMIIRKKLPYEIDGVVIKLNESKYYDDLGYTSKFPKWAIAYKFPATIAVTKLINITASVGRSGKITYVAELEPIILDGSKVSFASLHNFDYIKDRDIRINDYVNIFKAGDIIPYVENIILERRTDDCIPFLEIKNCPSCNSLLINDEGLVNQKCNNINCDERKIRQIEYFCSREIMNIDGISTSIINKLYKNNFINNEVDLYNLENKKNEIINLDLQIKEKLFEKIISSIEKSKNNSLERVIASLAIKNVGINTSKLLSKKFMDIDNLISCSLENLLSIESIAEKTATSIFEFFQDIKNIEKINSLREYGVNLEYKKNKFDNYDLYLEKSLSKENIIYHNKTFSITGTFETPRNIIKLIIEDIYKSKIVSTISKNIDFLILGDNCGSKKDKAEELKILTLSFEFWKK